MQWYVISQRSFDAGSVGLIGRRWRNGGKLSSYFSKFQIVCWTLFSWPGHFCNIWSAFSKVIHSIAPSLLLVWSLDLCLMRISHSSCLVGADFCLLENNTPEGERILPHSPPLCVRRCNTLLHLQKKLTPLQLCEKVTLTPPTTLSIPLPQLPPDTSSYFQSRPKLGSYCLRNTGIIARHTVEHTV